MIAFFPNSFHRWNCVTVFDCDGYGLSIFQFGLPHEKLIVKRVRKWGSYLSLSAIGCRRMPPAVGRLLYSLKPMSDRLLNPTRLKLSVGAAADIVLPRYKGCRGERPDADESREAPPRHACSIILDNIFNIRVGFLLLSPAALCSWRNKTKDQPADGSGILLKRKPRFGSRTASVPARCLSAAICSVCLCCSTGAIEAVAGVSGGFDRSQIERVKGLVKVIALSNAWKPMTGRVRETGRTVLYTESSSQIDAPVADAGRSGFTNRKITRCRPPER